jgi:hypothetical protein
MPLYSVVSVLEESSRRWTSVALIMQSPSAQDQAIAITPMCIMDWQGRQR